MTLSELPLLLDRDESARVLRCTPDDVDRLVDAGALYPVRLFPGDAQVRFSAGDLVDLVERSAGLARVPTGGTE